MCWYLFTSPKVVPWCPLQEDNSAAIARAARWVSALTGTALLVFFLRRLQLIRRAAAGHAGHSCAAGAAAGRPGSARGGEKASSESSADPDEVAAEMEIIRKERRERLERWKADTKRKEEEGAGGAGGAAAATAAVTEAAADEGGGGGLQERMEAGKMFAFDVEREEEEEEEEDCAAVVEEEEDDAAAAVIGGHGLETHGEEEEEDRQENGETVPLLGLSSSSTSTPHAHSAKSSCGHSGGHGCESSCDKSTTAAVAGGGERQREGSDSVGAGLQRPVQSPIPWYRRFSAGMPQPQGGNSVGGTAAHQHSHAHQPPWYQRMCLASAWPFWKVVLGWVIIFVSGGCALTAVAFLGSVASGGSVSVNPLTTVVPWLWSTALPSPNGEPHCTWVARSFADYLCAYCILQGAAVSAFLSTMLLFNIYLLWVGETTREHLKKHFYVVTHVASDDPGASGFDSKRLSVYRNPFNRGCIPNLHTSCCDKTPSQIDSDGERPAVSFV